MAFLLDPALLPDMPEQRRPTGRDTYTPAEERLLRDAALLLHRVDKEVESMKLRTRDTLADHARIIESRLGQQKPKPESGRTTPAEGAAPAVKARGARLVRSH